MVIFLKKKQAMTACFWLFDRYNGLYVFFSILSGLDVKHHDDDSRQYQSDNERQVQIQIKADFLIEDVDKNHISDEDGWRK